MSKGQRLAKEGNSHEEGFRAALIGPEQVGAASLVEAPAPTFSALDPPVLEMAVRLGFHKNYSTTSVFWLSTGVMFFKFQKCHTSDGAHNEADFGWVIGGRISPTSGFLTRTRAVSINRTPTFSSSSSLVS